MDSKFVLVLLKILNKKVFFLIRLGVHKTNIYESTSDIEFGIKKMKETYTTIKVNRSKKINIKQTALYFFPRNLINFLYEKFIYRSIYGLK